MLTPAPNTRVIHDAPTCSPLELLATVLGGKDAMRVSQNLLEVFGSLHGVAHASAVDLTPVSGVGQVGAARLAAAIEISRRLLAPDAERLKINSSADAAMVLRPHLMHREQEYLYVLLLDTRNQVIGAPHEIYHGSLNTSLIRVGEIFRPAIKANAAAIILSHNHPSGDPSPSPEDVAVTRAVVEAGKLLDIDVLDHLIIAGDRFVSLKERGLGFSA